MCPKFTCKNPMHKKLMIFNGSYPNIDVKDAQRGEKGRTYLSFLVS